MGVSFLFPWLNGSCILKIPGLGDNVFLIPGYSKRFVTQESLHSFLWSVVSDPSPSMLYSHSFLRDVVQVDFGNMFQKSARSDFFCFHFSVTPCYERTDRSSEIVVSQSNAQDPLGGTRMHRRSNGDHAQERERNLKIRAYDP